MGIIEGAVGDLEAAVKDGLLDSGLGIRLMHQIAAIARQLAADALALAKAESSADPSDVAAAQESLADGDVLRVSGAFKDAVNKYKDALAKVE